MAKNREMLKEAIAEAKAVKEAAIANAKAALEEAFTPQLKSMLSMKLQEMEEETNEAMYEGDDTEEVAEALGTLNDPDTETVHGNVAEEEDKDMMEVDLEELLAELENEEDEETLNEAEEEEAEEEEEEEGEEEGDTEMEDLSDDELKEMIEDVIAQMIKDGELEAGPEFEGEAGEEAGEEGEEMEMDAEEEEVDLAELLKEIEEMEEKEMKKDEKESVDEIFGFFKTNNLMNYLTGEKGVDKSTAKKVVSALEKNPNDDSARAELKKVMSADDINDFKNYISNPKRGPKNPLTAAPLKDAGNMVAAALTGKEFVPVKLAGGGDSPTSRALGETEEMKAELEEAYKTINSLRSELNEINLLNAKLLYTNKIFKSKNLNENQKVKVLSSFDKAKNVGEVKMVFETLNEGIKVKKSTIKENLGRASKATTIPTTKKPIVESNDVFARMQKLAGIIK